MTEILSIKPAEIEAKSFAMIEEEFHAQTGKQPEDFPPEEFAVIRRVIHATGDFSFADTLVFHPKAIETAIKSLHSGRNVATDVNMGASGINKTILGKWGGKVVCHVSDPEIPQLAADNGATRSETAIKKALENNAGIIAVGNAPTALLTIMDSIEKNETHIPDLVVGVPVGFVNAAESKDLLSAKDYPFITSLGRKGGSPVAAAIVNALMKLAIA